MLMKGLSRLNTEVLQINSASIDTDLIRKAAGIINSGGLVAFPTETVYGLGANALDTEAVKKIFTAKGRPADNPLIVHIYSSSQLGSIISDMPVTAQELMDRFWPGPLTLVLKKNEFVSLTVTAGLETVAVRMPSHPVALSFLRACAVPVAAPSANLSGRPSTTNARHVIDDLSGRIDMIIDSGSCNVGLESTVLDLTEDPPVILRPGGITAEQIEKVTGIVKYSNDNCPVRSPGMKYSHYSPQARVVIVTGTVQRTAERINEMAHKLESEGQRVGILASEQTVPDYTTGIVISAGDRNFPETIASNLFETLREFDRLQADIVLSESFDAQGLGYAIMNRMQKAAGYNIVRA